MAEIIKFVFLSLGLSFCLSIVVRSVLLRFGVLAHPGERKVHKKAVPEGGGIAVFITFFLMVAVFLGFDKQFLGFYVGAFFMLMTGILDDVFDVKARYKLLGQVAAVSAAIYFGLKIEFVTGPESALLNVGYFSIPLTFLWLLGITNAINFIDGLDGLAGGVGAIVAVTLGAVALGEGRIEVAAMCFILAAATIGFLPHNFSKNKKMFIGDSGSQFLGFSLASLSILGVTKVAAVFTMLAPVMILAIPIFDTAFAVIRRTINGQPIHIADRGHLHHRLLDLGFSHKKAVTFIYYVTIMLGITAVFSTKLTPKNGVILFAVTFSLIIGLSFLLSRQHGRE